MQTELDHNYPSTEFQILGVNEVGYDGNNGGFTDGRDLPWLQDIDANDNNVSDVWYDSWKIIYRDVVVVDANNEVVSIFNVTTNSLAVPENFEALRTAFVSTIVPSADSEWQNPIEALNVNGDDFIAPLDALLVINALSDYPGGVLPASRAPDDPFLDTTGNNQLSPLDALLVINQLTENSQTGGSLSRSVASPMAASSSLSNVPGNSAAVNALPVARLTGVQTDRPVEGQAMVDEVMAVYELTKELPAREQETFVDPFVTRRVQEQTTEHVNDCVDAAVCQPFEPLGSRAS